MINIDVLNFLEIINEMVKFVFVYDNKNITSETIINIIYSYENYEKFLHICGEYCSFIDKDIYNNYSFNMLIGNNNVYHDFDISNRYEYDANTYNSLVALLSYDVFLKKMTPYHYALDRIVKSDNIIGYILLTNDDSIKLCSRDLDNNSDSSKRFDEINNILMYDVKKYKYCASDTVEMFCQKYMKDDGAIYKYSHMARDKKNKIYIALKNHLKNNYCSFIKRKTKMWKNYKFDIHRDNHYDIVSMPIYETDNDDDYDYNAVRSTDYVNMSYFVDGNVVRVIRSIGHEPIMKMDMKNPPKRSVLDYLINYEK